MKLDVVSVVVEVEEVSNLPSFLLAQLLVEGSVELTGRVSAALVLLGTTGGALSAPVPEYLIKGEMTTLVG